MTVTVKSTVDDESAIGCVQCMVRDAAHWLMGQDLAKGQLAAADLIEYVDAIVTQIQKRYRDGWYGFVKDHIEQPPCSHDTNKAEDDTAYAVGLARFMHRI